MQKKIHPIFHKDTKARCNCGASFVIGSTQKEISLEICSQCHPFYTGNTKLLDTAGRVEKFEARKKAALAKQSKGK